MSQDASTGLDGVSGEGEDLATKVTIGVRSTEDVNKLRGVMLSDLDHQTATAGGNELNVIADAHSLSPWFFCNVTAWEDLSSHEMSQPCGVNEIQNRCHAKCYIKGETAQKYANAVDDDFLLCHSDTFLRSSSYSCILLLPRAIIKYLSSA
jgi:hypothetical protein